MDGPSWSGDVPDELLVQPSALGVLYWQDPTFSLGAVIWIALMLPVRMIGI